MESYEQNQNRSTDTWNRLSGWGEWMKDGEGIREHLCMTHGHRQQCGIDRRRGVGGAGWRWEKGEKGGTTVIL